MAQTRQQTLRGGSRYRCCRHPMEHHQRRLRKGVESKAYANGLVDGLVIGHSIGIGGVWGFNVCVPSPLIPIWTMCKAQGTSSGLQHYIEVPSLLVHYFGSSRHEQRGWWLRSNVESAGLTNQTLISVSQNPEELTSILLIKMDEI